MSNLGVEIHSFVDAAEVWHDYASPPSSYVHLRRNTWLHYDVENDEFVIRFHDTDIVRYDRFGFVWVDSGGHRSVTTRHRINEYTPVSVRVMTSSSPIDWMVTAYDYSVKFVDGMLV